MNPTRVFRQFVESERAGGILLLACTVVSLALANSTWGASWQSIWHSPLGPLTARAWINDALMAVFFLVVGLELERELYVGELSDFRAALLPVAAAAGGMLVPAGIHYALNHDTQWQAGAGIPMATDIAFALAALGVLGERVPLSLKVFLTAFAAMDDLGAIFVIAVAYSRDLSIGYGAASAAVFAGLVVMNRLRILSVTPYLAGGAVLWFFTLKSGVHPTVAGVFLAFAIPFEPRDPIERSPSHRVEHALHKPVALIVLPLFALANTAIVIPGERSLLGDSNSLGIVAGLVVGKPLGISIFSAMAVGMGLKKPLDLGWGHIVGAGILGGIGFTMSIFVANLAFPAPSEWAAPSTLGVMIASAASSLLGIAWLAVVCKKRSGRPVGR